MSNPDVIHFPNHRSCNLSKAVERHVDIDSFLRGVQMSSLFKTCVGTETFAGQTKQHNLCRNIRPLWLPL